MKIPNYKIQMSNSRREGFTLIELLIVLLIIGVSAGIIGIALNRNSGSHQLKTFAKELSAVLRYARSQAVSEKRLYCFVIDTNERMLKLYAENPGTDSEEQYTQVLDKPIPGELQIAMSGRDTDSSFIEFYPIGNSTGGVIEVSGRKEQVYSVQVNRITGKVEVVQGGG
jgi:general secretion pathway protein H